MKNLHRSPPAEIRAEAEREIREDDQCERALTHQEESDFEEWLKSCRA